MTHTDVAVIKLTIHAMLTPSTCTFSPLAIANAINAASTPDTYAQRINHEVKANDSFIRHGYNWHSLHHERRPSERH